MVRSHVVISGAGRAGTTFLVQLLTLLGLDTGLEPSAIEVSPLSRAGLELALRGPDPPYIVKSPYLCDFADAVLAAHTVAIDHVIIPVRRFEAAAASRAWVQADTTGAPSGSDVVAGGLWGTQDASRQATVLREKFTRLVEALVRYDVPMTFLSYPRLVRDPDYLREKLAFLLDGIDMARFREVFTGLVRPEWIHQFTEDDW